MTSYHVRLISMSEFRLSFRHTPVFRISAYLGTEPCWLGLLLAQKAKWATYEIHLEAPETSPLAQARHVTLGSGYMPRHTKRSASA
jgi:hypothetical protein